MIFMKKNVLKEKMAARKGNAPLPSRPKRDVLLLYYRAILEPFIGVEPMTCSLRVSRSGQLS